MAELVLPSGAIKVIQTQQNMVGGTIAGGAGSVSGAKTDNTPVVGVLEQIKEVSLKSFKGITRVATLLADTLNFEKANARRERDQAAELAKENKKPGAGFIGPMPKGGEGEDEGGSGLGVKGGFLAGLGLTPLLAQAKKVLTKIIAPFKKLLPSVSRLTPLLGRLAPLLAATGPIGLVISGLFLLVQYSDEIAKALSPVIEKMKQVFEELSPLIGFITEIADTVVKQAIVTIGSGLSALGDVLGGVAGIISGIFDTVQTLFTGTLQLLKGEISMMDFLKLIWDDGIKKILMAPVEMLQNLGNTMFDFVKGLVKSLPFGLGDKILSGMKGMTEGDQSGTAGDIAGEASMINAATTTDTQTTPDSKKSLFTSGGAYKSDEVSKIEEPKVEVIPKEKPKTINMDNTSGVTQVAEKISGDPNLPPLGMNMYNTTGDTWEERADQWRNFKAALVKAEKEGTISKEELDFRIMKMMDEKDRLKRAKTMIGIKKQKAELTGQQFDEASVLGEMDAANAETQQRVLAESGMTVQSFDEALNNKLKPNVNKRNLTGDGASGQGNVTVVNNQPQNINTSTNVAKNTTSSGPINTSSGDNYFDRQAYNAIV